MVVPAPSDGRVRWLVDRMSRTGEPLRNRSMYTYQRIQPPLLALAGTVKEICGEIESEVGERRRRLNPQSAGLP